MKRLLLLCIGLGLLIWPVWAQEEEAGTSPYYTYIREDGNRFIAGAGSFPDNVRIEEFQLDAAPVWLVAAEQAGVPWLYGMQANNHLVSMCFDSNDISCGNPLSDIDFSMQFALSEEAAPFIVLSDVAGTTVFNFNNPLSHPVPFGRGTDYWLSVTSNGELVLRGDGEKVLDVFSRQLAPDARVVISENGLIAVYAAATNQRYVHGIMGDDLEPTELWVFRIEDKKLEEVAYVALSGDAVFEGIFPFWADIDEDGMPDLVTTVSDSAGGARLRAYLMREDGLHPVDGPAIGRAYRWRHQLAFGPFGPNGEMELIDVLTPHIGGVIEWFRYQDGALVRVAALSGYTSHVINARNMDMAVIGDFNGDGLPEVVLPNQERTALSGIQRTEDGAEVVWTFPLNGRLNSNLTALSLEDGTLLLAAGLEDGRIRVWVSEEGGT